MLETTIGKEFSIFFKFRKHLTSKNRDRLKDYLVHFYTVHNPAGMGEVFPDKKMFEEIVQLLKTRGWTLGFDKKKGQMQFMCIAPDGKTIYRSKYPK